MGGTLVMLASAPLTPFQIMEIRTGEWSDSRLFGEGGPGGGRGPDSLVTRQLLESSESILGSCIHEL